MPTVAVINGFAFGWGVELGKLQLQMRRRALLVTMLMFIALCCDLRVAKANAVICFPECGLGIFPGASGKSSLRTSYLVSSDWVGCDMR